MFQNIFGKISFSNFILFFLLSISIAGCGGSKENPDDDNNQQSSAKALASFSLNGVTGTINEGAKSIGVTMPNGTDVTALVATLTTTGSNVQVSSTNQISGNTVNDYTNPVVYTVTAEDGTTVEYTVTVTVNNTVADTTNPSVTITAPTTGATVSGAISITADATDNIAVTRVDFSVDGGAVTTDTSAPYANTLDTTTLTNGAYTLNATAFDAAGNSTTTSVTVTVNNTVADTTNPSVTITSPTTGATVTGEITITADAADNIGVTRVDFSVGGGAATADTSAPYTNIFDTTTFTNGALTLEVTAFDAAGNSATTSVTVTVNNPLPDTTNPTVTITAPTTSATVSGGITITADAADNVAVTRVDFSVDGGAVTADTSAPYANTLDTLAFTNGAHTLEATAFDAAGNSASNSVTVTVFNEGNVVLPPDPITVAPEIDPTVATTMDVATKFLYTGANPIQTGVAPGTIKAERVAVLRGRVADSDGAPLPGVSISILSHPEFGQTLSRADGAFDLAVNGGGKLNVKYVKTGFLPVQRKLDVPWQDYSWVPDVVMIGLDPQVTTIDLTSAEPMQVAAGSEVTDADGTRTAVVMIPQGTTATITLPDGSSQNIETLNIRATEYTVGASGQMSMPGSLPPASGYTYAVELSVDEAIANGVKVDGKDVVFNQPVSHYVDNFLDFPVGEIVPVGYYNNDKGSWTAYDNGLVIGIVGVSGALADVDVDGDNIADSGTALSDLNITDAERTQLALRYNTGDSLWRVQIRHFSTWDHNWPSGPPLDGQFPPNSSGSDHRRNKHKRDNCEDGSTIYCQSQVLGERIPLTGLSMGLNYRSSRISGYLETYNIKIPITSSTVDSRIIDITLTVRIAGQVHVEHFPTIPNQIHSFTWDGKDGFGRPVTGAHHLSYEVSYQYARVYYSAVEQRRALAFGQFSQFISAIGGGRGNGPISVSARGSELLGGLSNKDSALAGWSLDVHHTYDASESTLFLGSGAERKAENTIGNTVTTVVGGGVDTNNFPDGVPVSEWRGCGFSIHQKIVFSADGTMYFSCRGSYIYKIDEESIIRKVVGGNTPIADGVPAMDAWLDPNQVSYISDFLVADDGTLYLAMARKGIFGSQVWRVDVGGIMRLVAGNASSDTWTGDGGPATEAALSNVSGLAIDADGSLHLADIGTHRIRKVADGIITTVAGNGQNLNSGDNGPAISASFLGPISLTFDNDGAIYVLDFSSVRKITPDGVIDTVVAVNGSHNTSSGDGGEAVDADLWVGLESEIVSDLKGNLFISELRSSSSSVIRKVDSNGNISTLIGSGNTDIPSVVYDQEYGKSAYLKKTYSLAVHPDGTLYYISDTPHGFGFTRIRNNESFLPGATATAPAVVSENGNEIYHFDSEGRHLTTTSSLTNSTLYSFAYNGDGQLISIADGDNKLTAIERDGAGEPTAIVAPGGQRNELTVDGNGYLQTVTNPAGEQTTLSYHPAPAQFPEHDGLLSTYTDPGGNTSTLTYDALGLLILDEDTLGGFKRLESLDTENGYKVTMTTAEGRSTNYEIQNLPTGEVRSIMIDRLGGEYLTQEHVDGRTVTTYPNGSVVTRKMGPDPRFGLQAPVLEEMTLTLPSGVTKTITRSRTATLSDPDDLASLTNLLATTTVDGRVAQSNFDALTNTHTKTSPLGRESVSVVDEQLRVLNLTLAEGITPIVTIYDDLGLVSRISQGAKSVDYIYDSSHRVSQRTDAAGNSVFYDYDAADRVLELAYADGTSIGYGYDFNGNRTSYVMPSGDTHSVTFTSRNRPSGYIPPGNDGFTENYNLDGQLTRRVLASGPELNNSFDGGGRLSGIIYPEASVSFSYLGNTSRIDTMTRTPTGGGSAQQITNSYDGAYQTAASYSGFANADFDYSFNDLLFLSGIQMTSGADIVNTLVEHDEDGLVTGFGPFTFARGGPGGALNKVTDSDLVLDLSYDNLAQLDGRAMSVNGSERYSLALSRNNLGAIEQKIETVSGTTHTYDYSYNAKGQLLEVNRDNVQTELYSYDDNANRLSTLTQASVYDSQDRINSHGVMSYSVDVDGFLAQRGNNSFSYSVRGELLNVTLGTGPVISYHYDAMSRRVARTDALGSYEYFYGLPGHQFLITAYRSPNGELTELYYDDAGLLFALKRGGDNYYVAVDQLGSPKLVTDASGAVILQREYDSFGQLLSDTNSGFDLVIGFAGGLEDITTGLVRFGFRDYDPLAGRWMARDPFLYQGKQANLYVYVGNNPVNHRDITGLFSMEASAYLGFGGGLKFAYENGRAALCAEGGVGLGGGIGGDLDGKVPEDGNSVVTALGYGCGPAGIGGECELTPPTRSGCHKLGTDCKLEASLGNLKADTSDGFQVKGDAPTGGKGACGASGKLAVKGCGSMSL